jgi:hypothetical protein
MLGKCLRDITIAEQAFATFQNLRKSRVEALIQAAKRSIVIPPASRRGGVYGLIFSQGTSVKKQGSGSPKSLNLY